MTVQQDNDAGPSSATRI